MHVYKWPINCTRTRTPAVLPLERRRRGRGVCDGRGGRGGAQIEALKRFAARRREAVDGGACSGGDGHRHERRGQLPGAEVHLWCVEYGQQGSRTHMRYGCVWI